MNAWNDLTIGERLWILRRRGIKAFDALDEIFRDRTNKVLWEEADRSLTNIEDGIAYARTKLDQIKPT